jgi:hypothetical protein
MEESLAVTLPSPAKEREKRWQNQAVTTEYQLLTFLWTLKTEY